MMLRPRTEILKSWAAMLLHSLSISSPSNGFYKKSTALLVAFIPYRANSVCEPFRDRFTLTALDLLAVGERHLRCILFL